MIENRMGTVWLSAVAVVLGVYLIVFPNIRIMPEMGNLFLKVELIPGNMEQDQILNDLVIPLEQKILRLDNVDDIESRIGPNRVDLSIAKKNDDSGSSPGSEIKAIIANTGADYCIETSRNASRPVFKYMVYCAGECQNLEARANDFKHDLETIPGIYKIEKNSGMGPLSDINAFKRYNGHRAVLLGIYILDRKNMTKTIARCTDFKEQYEDQYGLKIEPLNNTYRIAEQRVLTLYLFFLIIALAALGIGFLQGRNMLFPVLLALVGYEVSILLLQATGIHINMASTIGLFWFAGYGLVLSVSGMEFNPDYTQRQKYGFIFVLALSAVGYCIIFSSGFMITGILGRFMAPVFWACLFSILVPLVLCCLALRLYPPQTHKGDRFFFFGLEKFWLLVVSKPFAGFLIFFVAVLMIIVPIAGWKNCVRLTFFPKMDHPQIFVSINAGSRTEAVRELTRMEHLFFDMSEVDYVVSDLGLIYPYLESGFEKTGENIAQLTVYLKSGTDPNQIKKSIEPGPDRFGVHIEIRAQGKNASSRYPFKSHIYCDTMQALEKLSDDYCEKLETIPGISNVHTLLDSDTISRQKGRFYNMICADIDESATLKPRVVAMMQSYNFAEKGCEIQYDDLPVSGPGPELPAGLVPAFIISIVGLVLVLIFMGVALRSATVLLIPFSTVFIVAGIACLTPQVSLVNLLSILGIQSVWTLRLLMTLKAFNAGRVQDLPDTIIACMKQSFTSALVIYIPLIAGALFLWATGDFFIKQIGISFTGALIYLVYLDLALLPVVRSLEYKLFGS